MVRIHKEYAAGRIAGLEEAAEICKSVAVSSRENANAVKKYDDIGKRFPGEGRLRELASMYADECASIILMKARPNELIVQLEDLAKRVSKLNKQLMKKLKEKE